MLALGTERLLNSNAPPLDTEIPSLRALETTVQQRISDVEAELRALLARLDQMTADLESLIMQQSRIRGALLPLRRLPPELLSEVFRWTLPPFSSRRSTKSTSTRSSPWCLMHVSGLWRSIAASTPSLWARLETVYNKRKPYALPLLRAHAERAQKLYIDFGGSDSFEELPQVEALLALAEHSAKWVSLDIDLIPALLPHVNKLHGQLPRLQHAWVSWDRDEDPVHHSELVFLDNAPSLAEMGISNTTHFSQILLPSNLTRYNVVGPWEIHLELLQRNPSLIEVRMVTPNDEADAWEGRLSSKRDIHLPALRRLCISHGLFLARFDTPSLEEITYEVYPDGTGEYRTLAPLASLVAFSSCSLQHIGLVGQPESSDVRNALREFPSITGLYIMLADEDGTLPFDDIISNLVCADADGAECVGPKLAVLSFGWENEVAIYLDENPEAYTALAHMAATRCKRRQGCLRKVELLRTEGVWMPPDSAQAAFTDLAKEGVEVLLLTDEAGERVMDSYEHVAVPVPA
uniref:F-box domain-containing protein n=1 Tax=Mycena chlorophos TaxID=658473 RepID=A0ABQ0LMY0_MYCCL|nr:predicted protein [Mycena chlorophos]